MKWKINKSIIILIIRAFDRFIISINEDNFDFI